MASVPSLNKDMRNLRLSKYTPKAAADVKDWIEESLGERLSSGDLLESLKNGILLCRLVNLALAPPGIKYKKSSMPFVQMENISHFLRASQLPPFSLQPHDMFLTVDLYENKDPTQVLQCLAAFSRVAHAANPNVFRRTLGPKGKSGNGLVSPEGTGPSPSPRPGDWSRGRGVSNASQSSMSASGAPRPTVMSPTLTGGSNESRTTTSTNGFVAGKGSVSSWSKKTDEGVTAPAWNISQYGYMGGASQGNQGIAFGGRRQITSAGPHIPNMAEKEKRRREQALADEQAQRDAEEAEQLRRQREEEQERIAEEELWAEKTRVQREQERRDTEAEQRKWIEQEEKWKKEEEQREAEASKAVASKRPQRTGSDKLRGQFLSQYRAEHGSSPANPELARIQQLEAELEKAREREKAYEAERRGLHHSRKQVEEHDMVSHMRNQENAQSSRSYSRSPNNTHHERKHHDHSEDWREEERQYLRQKWDKQYHIDSQPKEPLPPAQPSPRPLPDPTSIKPPQSTASPRPLPDPSKYMSNKPSPAPKPASHFARELGVNDAVAEQHIETTRREQSQARAGGFAASSLLEREMENERRRQEEWELGQADTRDAVQRGAGVGKKEGMVGEGGNWDVNQYGWLGGDSQNRGAAGIGAGRRQIIGPRPPP
ncbi:MAG: hypothetical protein M1814_002650 [Vezdaea aestivalis]|nr:MAG: hypothetical protein M1814_002650 [Vezdaea aestivalis]